MIVFLKNYHNFILLSMYLSKLLRPCAKMQSQAQKKAKKK